MSAPKANSASYARLAPPVYPKGNGLQGRVLLDVRADGQVATASTARSSGHPALDAAAREAVAKWRFTPARNAGVAVASRVQVPIDFGPREPGAAEDAGALEGIQVRR